MLLLPNKKKAVNIILCTLTMLAMQAMLFRRNFPLKQCKQCFFTFLPLILLFSAILTFYYQSIFRFHKTLFANKEIYFFKREKSNTISKNKCILITFFNIKRQNHPIFTKLKINQNFKSQRINNTFLIKFFICFTKHFFKINSNDKTSVELNF